MSTSTEQPPAPARIFNVPNVLTSARLVLAIVLFVLIAVKLYLAAMIVFIVAASTDWLDGYWARRYGQVTQLGRIFDPFVDKIIICGAFIFLAAEAEHGSGVTAWMAVVVVGREMLVTALRGHFEQQGVDFSASQAGKWKMLFQCVAAGWSLYVLHYLAAVGEPPPDVLAWGLLASVWLAVLSTIYSGAGYVVAAIRLARR